MNNNKLIVTKSELYLEQMREFPISIIIDKEELLKYHKDSKQSIRVITNTFERFPNAVAYYFLKESNLNIFQSGIRVGLGREYTILADVEIDKN